MHISVQSPTIIILSVSSKFKLSNAKKPLVEFFLTIFIYKKEQPYGKELVYCSTKKLKIFDFIYERIVQIRGYILIPKNRQNLRF